MLMIKFLSSTNCNHNCDHSLKVIGYCFGTGTTALARAVAKPARQFGHAMLIFLCSKAVKTMSFSRIA